MGGGKSSSNSTTSSTTTTTTGTSTGNLGYVLQGEVINVDQNVSESVVDVFSQLVSLAGKAIDLSGRAGTLLTDGLKDAYITSKQPDVKLIENTQKSASKTQIYVIAGVIIIGAIFILRKK